MAAAEGKAEDFWIIKLPQQRTYSIPRRRRFRFGIPAPPVYFFCTCTCGATQETATALTPPPRSAPNTCHAGLPTIDYRSLRFMDRIPHHEAGGR
jgi:hypothetical protein